MKKAVKILLVTTGCLTLLIISAILILPKLVDPNDFKPEITQAVRDYTGRRLGMTGNLKLSVFPWLGVETGPLSLSNSAGFGDQPFASLEQADIKVKLLPLLSGQIEVSDTVLTGLALNLSTNAAGKNNWDDLTRPQTQPTRQPQTTQPDDNDTVDASATLATLRISSIALQEARITWDDSSKQQHIVVNPLNLQIDDVGFGRPMNLRLNFTFKNREPLLKETTTASARLTVNPALDDFRLEQVAIETQTEGDVISSGVLTAQANAPILIFNRTQGSLRLKQLNLEAELQNGLLQKGTLNVQLQAPDVSATQFFESAQLADLQLFTTLKNGPMHHGQLQAQLNTPQIQLSQARHLILNQLTLNTHAEGSSIPAGRQDLTLTSSAAIDLKQQSLALSHLSLIAGTLKLNADIRADTILDAPSFKGSISIPDFSPRVLLQQLAVTTPATRDPQALQRAGGHIRLSGNQDQIKLENIQLQLDDSRLNGNASVAHFQQPAIRFKLALDQLDADRYLPAQSAATEPVVSTRTAATGVTQANQLALEPLRKLDAQGELTVSRCTINGLKADRLHLNLHAKHGQIKTRHRIERLYQGHYQGSLGIDVRQAIPRITLDESLTELQIEPFLRDVRGDAFLSGTTQLNLKIRGEGSDMASLKAGLHGRVEAQFRDGSLNGVNIPRLIRETRARIENKPLPKDLDSNKTDFSEMTLVSDIHQGILNTHTLTAQSPLLRVQGNGQTDLTRETLAYKLTVHLVKSLEGQDGAQLKDLKGIPIPLQVNGSFENPDYGLDIQAALTEVYKAKLQQKAESEKNKLFDKAEKKLGKETGDLLRQLF